MGHFIAKANSAFFESVGYIPMWIVYFVIFYLIFKKKILEEIVSFKINAFFKIIIGMALGTLFYVFIVNRYINVF